MTTDSSDLSVGKLTFNVSRSVPMYSAIDSPQGNAALNGICLMRDLTVASSLDFDLDFSKDDDAARDWDVDLDAADDDFLFVIEDDNVSFLDLFLFESNEVLEVFDNDDLIERFDLLLRDLFFDSSEVLVNSDLFVCNLLFM